jgi:2-isopropylmalate synthase
MKVKKSDRSLAILNHVKELENMGYQFEGAEASVHLMSLHSTTGYCPPFQVLDYSAQVYDYHDMDSASRVVSNLNADIRTSASTARATIKVRTILEDSDTKELGYADDNLQVSSDGNGPVYALAKALLKALLPSHPFFKSVELIDHKVGILDPNSATDVVTRVMVEFRDSVTEKQCTNVVSASLNALIDGFEYA